LARAIRRTRTAGDPRLETALNLHYAGGIADAKAIYDDLLTSNPEDADALHLAGVAACQLGHPAEGVELLERAVARCPAVAEIQFNLGNALRDLDRLGEAVTAYRQALHLAPGYLQALANLGHVLRQLGRWQDAAEAYERVTVCKPGIAVGHLGLGTVLLEQTQFARAAASFRTAVTLEPTNINAWRGLGRALLNLGRYSEAAEAFRTVVLGPAYVDDYLDLSVALKELEQIGEALDASNRALAIEPENVRALFHVASILERRGAIEQAREAAVRALQIEPHHAELNIILARCEGRSGAPAAGVAHLQALSDADSSGDAQASVLFELGHLLDQVGDTEKAFRAFVGANEAALRRAPSTENDRLRHIAMIDRLHSAFTPEWIGSWTPLDQPAASETAPVFLVGFPRSGTTLLELVLDSHPELVTLDERPAVRALVAALERLPGGFLTGLSNLDNGTASHLHQVYFDAATQYVGDLRGRRLIDKLPLNILMVGPLVRVFPNARFILALRHPCDACLSCFMQNFDLNPDMMNFVNLKLAAAYYTKAMGLWQRYRSVLKYPCHDVRYEDLVADFDGTVKSLLEFIGVAWDDGVQQYAVRAKSRNLIATPSYGQVTEPIYAHARYRWKRYQRHVEPVLPVLRPFIREFGYAE